ncbi:DUF6328 family protein [Isoptericola sp. b441]|uniref:DUF6328 family protein n=1 Tax=Actinotalea lenta TaxID=3064654 RepID=A0ABT9DBF5_9CELL|nr:MULTISPECIES: DUF6328 family protein [unclassified Isoptericola]MDO8108215.1 DUF6328 family protein [Isoptericola sp. b441]MDO8120113.1 DUF6328 family protein [Isoptericola sp. b490]
MVAPESAPEQPDRHETPAERADRNWTELLAELRVLQTGAQILVGFLLTIPFQSRFSDLDTYQRTSYLVLVILAALSTVLIVAPVSMHRALFARHRKPELVRVAARFARGGLVCLALVLVGALMLIMDLVVSREAGRWVAAGLLVVIGVTWWAVPRSLARRTRLDPQGR